MRKILLPKRTPATCFSIKRALKVDPASGPSEEFSQVNDYSVISRFGIFSLLALIVVGSPHAAETKHLFILSGQSNMAMLDPEVSFRPTVSAALDDSNVIIVKDAMGSQPIRRWYKHWRDSDGNKPEITGDLYDRLLSKVHAAGDGIRLESVTFVWMQGERDARESHGAVYAASLRGLIEQLKNDLEFAEIHVVIGRINDHSMSNDSHPNWTLIRDAQVAVAESLPSSAWVNTDDLNGDKNDIHATPDGFRILGKRFAVAAIKLIVSEADP